MCCNGLLGVGERVVDRQDRAAGDAEADLDAGRLERADDGLGAGHAAALVGRGGGRCVVDWIGGHGIHLVVDAVLRRVASTASATSSVVDAPPRSGVRGPSSSTWRVRGLDGVGCGGLAELAQHHGAGQDHGDRVRLAGAGDVGRRAVDRLEDARAAVAERGGRREPDAARDRGGEVGEDVAEEVLGDDHVVRGRLLDQLHRHRVDELVVEPHVGELGGHLVGEAVPEPRRVEHVRLVDARQVPAPRLREPEALAQDALDLVDGVASVSNAPFSSCPRSPK